MKTRSQFRTNLAVFAAMTFLIGCGGDGSVAGTSFTGNWTQTPLDSHNTVFLISSAGVVNGRSENFTIGGTDILNGVVQANGGFSGRIQNDRDRSYEYSFQGTINSEVDSNHIRVIYDGTVDGAPRHVDMVMVRTGSQ